MSSIRQDPSWHQPDPAWSVHQAGGRPPAGPGERDVSRSLEALEGIVATLGEELERVRGEAAEAHQQARDARAAADAAQAAVGAGDVAGMQGGAQQADGEGADAHQADAEGAGDDQMGDAARAPDRLPPGRARARERATRERAGGGPAATTERGADPLADALASFAEELRAAADARARGELDAREALRLLRAGFHKTRRVMGALRRQGSGYA